MNQIKIKKVSHQKAVHPTLKSPRLITLSLDKQSVYALRVMIAEMCHEGSTEIRICFGMDEGGNEVGFLKAVGVGSNVEPNILNENLRAAFNNLKKEL